MIIKTSKREEIIDITKKVQNEIKNVKDGICFIYSKHTTAAISIDENDDPAIQEDFFELLRNMIKRGIWKHDKSGKCDRENADAHLKTNLIGNQKFIPVKNGKLELGKWQNIFFIEFDGPREREIVVKVIN